MLPLLIVALLIWAGVFAFIFSVDRRVRQLEKRFSVPGRTQERAKRRKNRTPRASRNQDRTNESVVWNDSWLSLNGYCACADRHRQSFLRLCPSWDRRLDKAWSPGGCGRNGRDCRGGGLSRLSH